MENKYHNSKIYSIRNTVNSEIYIGSTTSSLSKRMVKHRCDAKQRPYISTFYTYMSENGIENFYIELVEEYKCENIEQLRKREGEITREIGTLNERIEGRTQEEHKEYRKVWKRNNRDKINEQRREQRKANPEKTKEDYLRWKEWKQTKVECECGKTYRKSDKSKHLKSKYHQDFLNNNISNVSQPEEEPKAGCAKHKRWGCHNPTETPTSSHI